MSREQQVWREGDFYDNLAAAVDAVGYENLGVAWGIAHMRFESTKDRDQLLTALTRVPPGEGASYA
jgi:hypothetical protein